MKHITNDEYNLAFHNKVNKKIMRTASRQYRRVLGEDVDICELEGLWYALRKYDETRGMQFTSYLFYCVRNKCYSAARKILRKNSKERNLSIRKTPDASYHNNYLFTDIAMSLNQKDAKLLNDRYIEGKTLLEIGTENDVSFQAIDQRLETLNKKIRRILTE